MSIYDALCPVLESLARHDFRVTWPLEIAPLPRPRDLPAIARVPLPAITTDHLPRTPGKIAAMRKRYARREQLFHPADASVGLGGAVGLSFSAAFAAALARPVRKAA